MNRMIRIFLSMFAVLAASPAFACEHPAPISMPNGQTATVESMTEGQLAVADYVASMSSYLECIVEEESQARKVIGDLQPDVEQAREHTLDAKYKAAIAQMETVAGRFNTEVRKFRGQKGKKRRP